MTITKEQFEHEVPAFRTPEPEGESTVWEALQVHLDEALRHVRSRYGIDLLPSGGGETAPAAEGYALHLVCVRAARRAMAGADLVLTATGFGIVSNQNLAPASTVRVQALTEELRRDESSTADRLAFALLKDSAWAAGEAARRIVSRLMWCPMLLRRHGVAVPAAPGREPYAEEYRALLPAVEQAEARVAELISPELYAALVGSRRVRPADEEEALALDLLTGTARNLVAAHLAVPATAAAPHRPTPAQAALTRRLLRLVKAHADSLPAWQESATRRAQEAPRYENRKTDPCFFF